MILEKIRQVYPTLTKSQKKLADFIANSYQEAAFMTASRMARRLGVNEATVIRFAQRLGYPGYPELIRDVQAVVQGELGARGEEDAAIEGAFLTALNSEVENLSRAVGHVSPQLAHRLVTLIRGMRRAYIAGQGASFHLAGLLAVGLADLGLDAQVVPGDAESLALALGKVESGDVFVGVTATTDCPEIARAIEMAREQGARTLAVSGPPISRAAQAADLALSCPANDLFPVHSMAVVAAFLDALIQTAYSLDRHAAGRFAQGVEENAQRLRA